MVGDDYEGPLVFDDDQYEEESMLVYDIDIEDVIKEEEGFIGKGGFGGEEDNIEDVVVVTNDLCSSMIQTTLNVDFEKDINTKSHELMSFEKSLACAYMSSSKMFPVEFHMHAHAVLVCEEIGEINMIIKSDDDKEKLALFISDQVSLEEAMKKKE
ncbi:hypothetical protein Tco_1026973 [Tanacetum coccineum]